MPFFTEEEDKYLRANWGKMYASKIGKALGGRTKNSVIGRAGRLDLPNLQKPKTPRQRKQKQTLAKNLKHVPVAKVTLAPLATAKISSPPREVIVRKPLNHFRRNEPCQYPIGDSPNISFMCDTPRVSGSAYCAPHHRLCYTTHTMGGQATPAQAERVDGDGNNRAVEHIPSWKPAYGPLQLAASVETQDMTI